MVESQSPAPIVALSVAVMTFNEEENLDRCLGSVARLGAEIFILDSYSTDKTLDIANRYGARIVQHDFETFYRQRRRLIQGASYDWILLLDADEWLSPELKTSVEQVLGVVEYHGYEVNRRNRIGDTWVRYGSWYPDRKLRLFDRRRVHHIDNDPHDRLELEKGLPTGHLKGDLLHQSDRDFSSRFQAIERYTTRAAEAYFAKGKRSNRWRLLFRPMARFFRSFVLKRGFLDGYYGWIIAQSEAYYVWMREVKLWEIERNHRSETRR